MIVYVTVMYRYGETEAPSYVLGVWSTAREAECAGTVESLWRGGKYAPRVFTFTVDANEYDEVP